jgi:hypothetical protein
VAKKLFIIVILEVLILPPVVNPHEIRPVIISTSRSIKVVLKPIGLILYEITNSPSTDRLG